MKPNELDASVERRLRSAEHLATAAVRTIRVSMPHIPSRYIASVLDGVERLFSQIEATEHMIRLARAAGDSCLASAYADTAYALARLALDDASERVRIASAAETSAAGARLAGPDRAERGSSDARR